MNYEQHDKSPHQAWRKKVSNEGLYWYLYHFMGTGISIGIIIFK